MNYLLNILVHAITLMRNYLNIKIYYLNNYDYKLVLNLN